MEPLMTGKPAMPARVEKYKQSMENTLDQIENDWLGDKKWIAGDEITVADIFAACEIEQPSNTLIFIFFTVKIFIFRNCWI